MTNLIHSSPYTDSITLTEFLLGERRTFSQGRAKSIFFPPGLGRVLPFTEGQIWLVGFLTGNPILVVGSFG